MVESPERRDVLLIAANLNERRLLYGELLEAGYDVMPVPGAAIALGQLLQKSVEPRLVLLDVRDDQEVTTKSVEYLLTLISAPLIVVVGAIDRELWTAIESSVAALLARPITIGQIVEAVKRTLPPPRAVS
jgi:AmiR/NasT family two-component response regulator